MKLLKLIRYRLTRKHFGPTEARILYDGGVAFGSAVAVCAFHEVFMSTHVGYSAPFLITVALLVLNAVCGVYTKYRTARGRTKARVLTVATLLTAVLLAAFGIQTSVIALWLIIALPLLAIARLLISAVQTPRHVIVSSTVRQRGPVLVIGGAGYIGSHVVDQLLKSGETVRVLDKLMYGKQALESFAFNRNFELIDGDTTDIAKLTAAMRGASAVIHLAGLVGDPACAVDKDFTRHTNTIATRMAREVAQAMGVYRFIFASSCSVYGTSDKEVKEGDELNPVSLYAQTKIDSERELLHNAPDDFFITVLRFATVFGHSFRPRFDLVGNLFTAQAINEGRITVMGPDQWRPFIHCRDLARAIITVLKAEPYLVQSQVFNVGDKRLNMTILELAEAVKKVVQVERSVDLVINNDVTDKRNYAVSFEKIRTILGFQAETLLEDGIREIADQFKAGGYNNYQDEIYSNLKITKRVVSDFHDPQNLGHLYAPLKVQNQ